MNMKIKIEKISFGDQGGVAQNIEIEIPASVAAIEKMVKTAATKFEVPTKVEPTTLTQTPTDNASLGQTLASRIEFCGYDRLAFAKKIGVSPESVRMWCIGKTKPSADRVQRMAEVFGVSVGEVRRLLPRKRSHRALKSPRVTRAYSISWETEDTFVASNGDASVRFTAKQVKFPGKNKIWTLDQVLTGRDTGLAIRLVRDSKISGFGRALHMARVNHKKS